LKLRTSQSTLGLTNLTKPDNHQSIVGNIGSLRNNHEQPCERLDRARKESVRSKVGAEHASMPPLGRSRIFRGNLAYQCHRIRHKKCDEARPSCIQCSSTGRCCDFASESCYIGSDLLPSSLPTYGPSRSSFEANLFDFFRLVCAKEFALLFGNPLWENLVLSTAHAEPSMYHATLAISALSRMHYSTAENFSDLGYNCSVNEYSLLQYNLAIQFLNTRLDGSAQSAWLAVLGSIIFINIDFLRGQFTLTSVHLCGGLSLVQDLKHISHNTECFEDALHQIRDQVTGLDVFTKAQ